MSDEEDEGPSPRTTAEFLGHSATEQRFWHEFNDGQGHHSWILAGPKGTGKATFAYRAARALLAEAGADEVTIEHPVFKRIANGAHTDLLVIEPAFDERNNEQKREIGVDEVRRLSEFLSLTPAEGRFRIVIIDSADALNVNAANAILKQLEEPPPASLILLVSHNPGSLLPTIRSRCAMLSFEPINDKDYSHLMRGLAPELSSDQISFYAAITNRSPGASLTLHRDKAYKIYQRLIEIFSSTGAVRSKYIAELTGEFQKERVHARWSMLTQLTLTLITRAVHHAYQHTDWQPIAPGEEQGVRHMLSLMPAHAWAKRFPEVSQQFSVAARQHLDYKTALITLFHELGQPQTRAA